MRRRRTGGPGLGWSAVALFVIAVLLCVGGLMDTGLPTQQSDVQALNKEPSEYGVETEDTSHQKSTLPGEELRDLTGDSSDGDATYGVSTRRRERSSRWPITCSPPTVTRATAHSPMLATSTCWGRYGVAWFAVTAGRRCAWCGGAAKGRRARFECCMSTGRNWDRCLGKEREVHEGCTRFAPVSRQSPVRWEWPVDRRIRAGRHGIRGNAARNGSALACGP